LKAITYKINTSNTSLTFITLLYKKLLLMTFGTTLVHKDGIIYPLHLKQLDNIRLNVDLYVSCIND